MAAPRADAACPGRKRAAACVARLSDVRPFERWTGDDTLTTEVQAMRRLLMIGAVAAGAAAAGFYYKVRPWWKSWGVDPAEAELPMAGDDLVREPNVTDTRGITIDAPPSAIWPWLVHMGYGRGGWYSYDRMDMKGRSVDTI